jgi:hypothetical protein
VYDHYGVYETEDGEEYVFAPEWMPVQPAKSGRTRSLRDEPEADHEHNGLGVVYNGDRSGRFASVMTRRELEAHLFASAQEWIEEYVDYGTKPATRNGRRVVVTRRIRAETKKLAREAKDADKGDLRRPYRPLTDDGLILRFVSTYEKTNFTTAAVVEWVHDHGVLGLSGEWSPVGWLLRFRGGPGESVRQFREAAEEAWRTVGLLEAATGPVPDIDKIRRLLESPSTSRAELRERALTTVKGTVRRWVADHVRMVPHDLPGLAGLGQGYSVSSLMGAMYLQLYWVMSEQSDLRRCKAHGCNRLFPVGTPPKEYPSGLQKNARGKGTYKGRADREYCNSCCKSNHHYYRNHLALD